ncbi:hypothetical protein ZWY2020_059847 [Hordeum vulgare]|nr:hypothetical protein ZWY2020_059847 [Hordeum vulgare]
MSSARMKRLSSSRYPRVHLERKGWKRRGKGGRRKKKFDTEGEERGEGGGDSEAEYSEDLKVFIGNLPFTVDSAQLAGLFEQAGSVEMVV